MCSNPQETVDLVKFDEEILDEKRNFFMQCIPCHASQMLIFSKILQTVTSARTMIPSCTTTKKLQSSSSCQEQKKF